MSMRDLNRKKKQVLDGAAGRGKRKRDAVRPAGGVTFSSLTVRWPNLSKVDNTAVLELLRGSFAADAGGRGRAVRGGGKGGQGGHGDQGGGGVRAGANGAGGWRVVTGINAVSRSLEAGRAALVVASRKTRLELIQHLPMAALLRGVPICGVAATPQELGAMFGLKMVSAFAWECEGRGHGAGGAVGRGEVGGGAGGGKRAKAQGGGTAGSAAAAAAAEKATAAEAAAAVAAAAAADAAAVAAAIDTSNNDEGAGDAPSSFDKGTQVVAERDGSFVRGVITGPSKKAGQWKVKFDADGKVFGREPGRIKRVAVVRAVVAPDSAVAAAVAVAGATINVTAASASGAASTASSAASGSSGGSELPSLPLVAQNIIDTSIAYQPTQQYMATGT
jgi:ribosomal protein L7Ae-like RNA K-turn-binding protein